MVFITPLLPKILDKLRYGDDETDSLRSYTALDAAIDDCFDRLDRCIEHRCSKQLEEDNR